MVLRVQPYNFKLNFKYNIQGKLLIDISSLNMKISKFDCSVYKVHQFKIYQMSTQKSTPTLYIINILHSVDYILGSYACFLIMMFPSDHHHEYVIKILVLKNLRGKKN